MSKRISSSSIQGAAGTCGLVGLALALAAASCGGTQKPPRGGAGGAGSPGPESSDPMAVLAKPGATTRAVSTEEREDFGKALARYQELRKKGPLSGTDCDRAAKAFSDAADANPKLVEARFNQGQVLLECGREAEAMAIFQKLASGPNPSARAITNLGLDAWKKGNRAEAERLFNRAVEIDPNINSATARNNLAQILRDKMIAAKGNERNQHAQAAIRHLRTVLAIDGSNLQAYATLCYIYYELGLDDMARLVGDQAVRRADEIATGKFEEERGASSDSLRAPGKGGKGSKAPKGKDESTVRKVEVNVEGTGYTREMNEQLALVHNTLGLVDLRKKNVTGALANFGRAIERNPSMKEARMNRAAISLNFRNYGTAEEDFRAVLKQDPRNFEAAIGLGVALRGNRKISEAEEQYQVAMKLDPQNPRPYFNMALLYQDYKGGQRSELERAQQYYREYMGKAGASLSASDRKATEKRIKDIDDMFAALAEAEKLQREFEEMLRKQEEQQKQLQEEMQKMQEQERQQLEQRKEAAQEGAGAGSGAASPAATAPGGV